VNSSSSRRPTRIRSVSAVASLLLAAILGVLGAVTVPVAAAAHDEFVGSDPAAGSTVAQAPAALTLTFSGLISPEEGATVIEVTDASGADLVEEAAAIQENTVTQPLLPATGPVTVLWKVVSSDGHPISGEFGFTVAGASSPAPSPTETAAPATSDPAPAGSDSPATAEPSPSATPAPAADATSVIPWVIVGIVLAAAGGVLVYLLLARAQGRRPGTGPGAER
jgi:hypothetical protein